MVSGHQEDVGLFKLTAVEGLVAISVGVWVCCG